MRIARSSGWSRTLSIEQLTFLSLWQNAKKFNLCDSRKGQSRDTFITFLSQQPDCDA